ncbi:MAG TPA: hypothetical protein VFN88_07070 [Caulobacteraceae bacterium]|nr:hypothetical protein [Caulobacteraceae bacterium]
MKPAAFASLLITAAALPTVALAQDLPKAKVKSGYTAPRAADGHPEIEGIWSNATTTRLERPANFGDRLTLTPQELAQTEKATAERNARQNAPTSKKTYETWKTEALKPDNTDECRSGSRGTACGYNAGWTDPGDLVMRVGGQPRTSFITFPADGRIPPRIATAGRAQAAETGEGGPAQTRSDQNDNPEGRSLAERCILMGAMSGPVMTPGLYNNTYRILQTKDTVAIWVEMIHDVRLVKIGAKHVQGVRPYMGDSIGWWDGDSLVVETTNYRPGQNVRGGDENLKVTERFTRVGPDRLHYAFKVEDPTVWAQPWGGEYEFSATSGIYEYACHEGNYGLEGILAGARAEDKVAESGGTRAGR